jgi:WD40 repeat protein
LTIFKGHLRVYQRDGNDWTLFKEWKAHEGVIRSVRWHKSGDMIISTSAKDKSAKVWDATAEGSIEGDQFCFFFCGC